MTSRELIRWSSLHERRARAGGVLGSPLVIAIVAGGALAGWVAWRATAGDLAASHAWRAGALIAFALAFMRVPFHVYWRADGPLLATLPIENAALFDAALWRCVRAAAATTLAVTIATIPLAQFDVELAVRHALLGAVMGSAAALFLPAVVVWTASLVALDEGSRAAGIVLAATLVIAGPARRQMRAQAHHSSSTALLGAVPGFASATLIVFFLIASPWVHGATTVPPATAILSTMVVASLVAAIGARARGRRAMGAILRDVSSLDRQRLAMTEIHPPTAIERAIAALIGDAAIPYAKDARLMRRRYPMAYAVGALVFLTLGIMAFARLADPAPWLFAAIGGGALYGLALGGRLHRPPIELTRLAQSLPITAAARHRAKIAWVLGWWTTFVVLPGVAASLRQTDRLLGLLLVAGGTVLVVGATWVRRD